MTVSYSSPDPPCTDRKSGAKPLVVSPPNRRTPNRPPERMCRVTPAPLTSLRFAHLHISLPHEPWFPMLPVKRSPPPRTPKMVYLYKANLRLPPGSGFFPVGARTRTVPPRSPFFYFSVLWWGLLRPPPRKTNKQTLRKPFLLSLALPNYAPLRSKKASIYLAAGGMGWDVCSPSKTRHPASQSKKAPTHLSVWFVPPHI